MPRPPRSDSADAVYHVSSRGNGRADVFLSDGDRQRLLGQLGHHLQLTVSRHFGIDPGVLGSHGHHAGPAKAVAVTVASRLAEATGRQIGLHYGIGCSAVRAIHRRLADRPDALKVVESLVRQLRGKRVKYKV
jgi:tetrahydromethanopterin S-methyltransferase subunit G